MKYRTLIVIAFILPTLACADGVKPNPPTLPKEISDSAAKIKVWLRSLNGKSEEEIAQLLGKNGKHETWEFRGNKEPKLVFQSGDDTQLMIFFWEGKVVRAAQLLGP